LILSPIVLLLVMSFEIINPREFINISAAGLWTCRPTRGIMLFSRFLVPLQLSRAPKFFPAVIACVGA
ncbi:hypothetical protein C7212DRAFT_24850, partial [Tuber magnatum]